MSVIVVGRFKSTRADIEKVFADRGADFKAVSDEAQGKGAIHHCFAAGDGEILIIDEWDKAESFHAFFESQAVIPQLMQAANVQGPPTFEICEKLDSPDVF